MNQLVLCSNEHIGIYRSFEQIFWYSPSVVRTSTNEPTV